MAQGYPQTGHPTSRPGEPTWELANFFPRQGEWTEEAYLTLNTNHLVELTRGCLEFLPMPTHGHQMVVAYLYRLLATFVEAHSPGVVLFAPLRVRLWAGQFREPDVLYMRAANRHRIHDYWDGADLLMEVVSPTRPEHDRQTKRSEYAQAGIPEYWIVDLLANRITVLVLDGSAYRVHGDYGPGETASSATLLGFEVSFDGILAAAAQ
jgi:Uma2 family endonuclease